MESKREWEFFQEGNPNENRVRWVPFNPKETTNTKPKKRKKNDQKPNDKPSNTKKEALPPSMTPVKQPDLHKTPFFDIQPLIEPPIKSNSAMMSSTVGSLSSDRTKSQMQFCYPYQYRA